MIARSVSDIWHKYYYTRGIYAKYHYESHYYLYKSSYLKIFDKIVVTEKITWYINNKCSNLVYKPC